MSGSMKRKAFTVTDLVAVIIVAVLLTGLLLPAISRSQENQRRDTCADKLHRIGIALHNHHDAYKRFPTLSTHPYPQGVGSTNPPITGCSWLARILPFMDEVTLYSRIAAKSDKFRRGAFDGALVDDNGRHLATTQLDKLVCPDFLGAPISKLSGQGPYAGVQGQDLTANPPIGIGISTYVALSATDIARMKEVTPDNNSTANGVIVPNKGLSLKAIVDGTSRTLIVSETREESVNAWIAGGVNWVVGANSNDAAPPKPDQNGYLVMAAGDATALNIGPGNPQPSTRYLTQANSPNGHEWAWGPSSQHAGNVVMHLYADGTVHPMKTTIDPTLYIQLITRNGREPVPDPATL